MFLLALAFPSEPRRRPRVLIVEDHRDSREMYAQFLSTSFEILQAADGREALEAIQQHHPDVIVTDLSLPGMDGFELVRRLRRHAASSRIPVLCLSGHGGDLIEERARKAGFDRIVQKPCLPDALSDTLLQLLAETRRPE